MTISVSSIYTPQQRKMIREALAARKVDLDVGMTRYHSEITRLVHANNARIVRPTGTTGLCVDTLSLRTLYNFFYKKRTEDESMAILDAYGQLIGALPNPVVTIH